MSISTRAWLVGVSNANWTMVGIPQKSVPQIASHGLEKWKVLEVRPTTGAGDATRVVAPAMTGANSAKTPAQQIVRNNLILWDCSCRPFTIMIELLLLVIHLHADDQGTVTV